MPLPCTLCLAFFEEPIHPSLGKPDLSCRTRLPAGISGNKQRLPTLQSWVLPKAQRTALRWRLLIQDRSVIPDGPVFLILYRFCRVRQPLKNPFFICKSPRSNADNRYRQPLKITVGWGFAPRVSCKKQANFVY